MPPRALENYDFDLPTAKSALQAVNVQKDSSGLPRGPLDDRDNGTPMHLSRAAAIERLSLANRALDLKSGKPSGTDGGTAAHSK